MIRQVAFTSGGKPLGTVLLRLAVVACVMIAVVLLVISGDRDSRIGEPAFLNLTELVLAGGLGFLFGLYDAIFPLVAGRRRRGRTCTAGTSRNRPTRRTLSSRDRGSPGAETAERHRRAHPRSLADAALRSVASLAVLSSLQTSRLPLVRTCKWQRARASADRQAHIAGAPDAAVSAPPSATLTRLAGIA